MILPSLKVTHRLLIGFGALAFLVLLIAGVVWGSAAWQAQRLNDVHQAGTKALHHASGMAEASTRTYKSSIGLLLDAMPEDAAQQSPDVTRAVAEVESALDRFRSHLSAAGTLSASESARLRDVEAAFNRYETAVRAFVETARAESAPPARLREQFQVEVQPYYTDSLEPLLAEHLATSEATIGQRVQAAEVARRWSLVFLMGALGLMMAGLIAIATVSSRHVGGGLERLVVTARNIASGQLVTPLRVSTNDEFGEITEALNDLVVTLSSATVSKTYVENIVHHMADPLLVVDPDVCVSMVNQALLDLLGHDEQAIVGASITRIFGYTGRNRGAAIKRDIERGLTRSIETTFRTREGKTVPVSVSCALVRSDGEIRGLVIVAKDITLQKQREDELIRARDEAERMVQLRDAFLANMSHEIRTPLTGILGSAQILAEAVEGEHRNLACIIEDAGTRLLDTINSVLEMARIEAGEVQPEMEVLDFAKEAQAVANVLRPIASKKDLVLSVELPEEGCAAAQLDRSCLNRILNNLIGNAIKFTNEGGVSVEVSAVDDEAVITVRDSGIGISKEFLPHLFDDFKQESTGFKRSHEGSGLGLAITRKLVEMMGGNIHVDSVKGLGSAFTIRFPRAPVDAVVAAASPSASDDQRIAFELRAQAPWETGASEPEVMMSPPLPPEERIPRDILLIEDNQQNAYMARFMLEGFSTDVANTPDEALELARRHQYAVLLVDINLGTNVSGIDLLKMIRKVKGYQRTSAVAVTAYALPGDRERFLKEGFSDYVSKPYRKEVLQAAVQRAIESIEQTPHGSLDEVFDSFKETVDAVASGVPASPGDPVPVAFGPDRRPAPERQPEQQTAVLEQDAAKPQPYPTASPDDFLPATFRPGRQGSPQGDAPPPHDDAAVPADFRNPAGGAGDGAGWPPHRTRR